MAGPEVRTELSAPFWEAAAEGRFVLQACACGAVVFPPRVVCPQCWKGNLGWEEAGGWGTVYACSVVHRPPTEEFADRVPYVVAIVTLDEGPRMMTNVVGCDPEAVAVGTRVRVRFEAEHGHLPVFAPAEGER